MEGRKILKPLIFILICEAAGIMGAIFTFPAIGGWYKKLIRPEIAPPNWVFSPVWTILFFLMGISLYLVWESDRRRNAKPIYIFAAQLALNVLWSVLFFGFHSPFLALIEIVFLWAAIVWTIIVFYRISKPAGLILLPYAAWVGFAIILNFSFWLVNT